jgi:multidrug transporter EmrE-like cation transporter
MTLVALLLILLSHSSNVAGQIVMKTAIHAEGRGNRFARFTLAIAGMTLSFFLTLGLLQRFDLSFLYPFQASSVILMAIGARIFLGETLSRRNLLALAFIVAGIALVSSS